MSPQTKERYLRESGAKCPGCGVPTIDNKKAGPIEGGAEGQLVQYWSCTNCERYFIDVFLLKDVREIVTRRER